MAALGLVGLDAPLLVEFVVENTGGGTLVCDPSESCSGAFEFIDGFEPFTLAAGETHPLTVRFTATAETNYECTFFVTPDCAAKSPRRTGRALRARTAVAELRQRRRRLPAGARLGGPEHRRRGDRRTTHLAHLRAVDLRDRHFLCICTLPGEQQAFQVRFTPEMVGHELSCTMASDCGSIQITGTGAHIDIQPAVVDVGPVHCFGVGQQTITFTNLSSFPMTFDIEDDPFDDF